MGLLPAAAGMVLFGGMQRHATRFARPELWVFGALLGAEAMIVLAVAVSGGALTPALALLCWPVAGVAGRFPDRASRLGTVYAAMLATGAILLADADVVAEYPLALALPLVALAAVHTVSTVLRDSDVEHRGASVLDPLTGMLNRTALDNRTAEIEHQSRLTGEPVAVLVADLDRFKLVNDNHGHATGDAVLQEVAYRLRTELRAYDLAYRLGGEEFVILLLGGTPAATTATAEQLREAVAAEPIVGLDITVSVGVAASAPGTLLRLGRRLRASRRRAVPSQGGRSRPRGHRGPRPRRPRVSVRASAEPLYLACHAGSEWRGRALAEQLILNL